MLILLIHEIVKIANLFTHQQAMLSLEIGRSFPILEFVILFLRVLSTESLSISTSTDVGKKLCLHEMILVIDGVNERMLSVML